MIKAVLSDLVQDFISENSDKDPAELALKHSNIGGVPVKEVLSQIISAKKATGKWLDWQNIRGIYYPPPVSVEQSSSSFTGIYKSQILNYSSVLDLTGGSGIDSYYFSKRAKQVTYVERNSELCEIARHNFSILGTNNITCINDTAENFPATSGSYDLIYLDPARRDSSSRKYRIEDCEPDLFQIIDTLKAKSSAIMLKLSPLLDIKEVVNALGNVAEVHVVAIKNEVKELLLCLTNKEKKLTVTAANHDGEKWNGFTFEYNEEKEAKPDFGNPASYIYEPNAAIMKAGAFKSIAAKYNLMKIAPSSHLYTSSKLIFDFPGRIFEYKGEVKAKKKELAKVLPVLEASVFTRNYPLKADQLKTRLGLKESKDTFLAGTTLHSGKKTLLLLKRI